MRDFLKKNWKWLLIVLAVIFIFLQWSGKTVIVLNNAYTPICEVHISPSPDTAEWGPDRVPGDIKWPNSFDIHLPMYLTWFRSPAEKQLHMWALDCAGNLLEYTIYPEEVGHTYTWQVSKP